MKNTLFLLTIALGLSVAAPASAACYADYKAKKDNPLRLHYGVIELSAVPCPSAAAASSEVAARLRDNGWVLLNVLRTFDEAGLQERKESAGQYFLRY